MNICARLEIWKLGQLGQILVRSCPYIPRHIMSIPSMCAHVCVYTCSQKHETWNWVTIFTHLTYCNTPIRVYIYHVCVYVCMWEYTCVQLFEKNHSKYSDINLRMLSVCMYVCARTRLFLYATYKIWSWVSVSISEKSSTKANKKQ